jgi:hypothetical protein
VVSIIAFVVIALVLTFSTLIWYSRITFNSKSLRLLAAAVLVSAQILLEVYLTFDASPLRLSHIPILHLFVLAVVYLSSRESLNRVRGQLRFSRLTKIKVWSSVDLRNLLSRYWFLPPFVFSIGVGIYPALLGGPSTVDERAYHWPQILGIVQNNGFTTFDSSLPWTYTYPLGKAVSSAFTWPFVQTDLAFRSIQILFGVIALLSVYILGRNFSHLTGVFVALILASSPVFSVMLRMSSDDLAYGAFILASLALISEASTGKTAQHKEKLYFLGLLSFALSGQFKFPVISTLLILPLALRYIFTTKNSKVNILKYITILTVAIVTSFIYAFRNLVNYSNPFYPMTVQIGDLNLFKGPLMSINNETIGASTTFSTTEPFRLLKIWHATFFDFFQVPNEDSLGSYNFIVGTLLIGAFFFALSQFKTFNTTFRIIMCSSLFLVLIMPGVFLPRYGFSIIIILAIFSVNVITPILSNTRRITIFACLVLLGLTPIVLQNNEARKWIQSQATNGNIYKNGQSFIDRRIDLASDGTVLPARSVRWIQGNVSYRQSVCYAAATNYPSSYWNLQRTSIVRYEPISESDRYPNSNNQNKLYGRDQIKSWLKKVDGCDYLVTYNALGNLSLLSSEWEIIKSGSSGTISMYRSLIK